MPITSRRAVGLWSTPLGIVLTIIGLTLIASTGGFAYFGLAGWVSTTYTNYVFYDATGLILVVVGALVAVFL